MTTEIHDLPIGEVHESPLNPRHHFDAGALEQLANSLQASGMLTPVLVRPRQKGGGYELAAGHRRRRAALQLKWSILPAIVREMDDQTFIEALNVENLQRDGLQPLEEAQGFQTLITGCRYDVAKIAERVGRSHRYVYDRLSLLELIEPAKKLCQAGEIPVAHAVLLARLGKTDQARALNLGDLARGGLFTMEHQLTVPDSAEERAAREPRKVVSLREFEGWIDSNVRFRLDDKHVPTLFPETQAAVAAAVAVDGSKATKVIPITYEYHLDPKVKDEDGARTYGPMSWRRADGTKGNKACEHAVLGVVMVGPARGQTFDVCIAKKACKVHWREEQQRSKPRASGDSDRQAARVARENQQRAEREAAAARWNKAAPALLKALLAVVAKDNGTGAAARYLLDVDRKPYKGKVKNATEVVRLLAERGLRREIHPHAGWWAAERWPEICKAFGVDAKRILDEAAPVAKEEAK